MQLIITSIETLRGLNSTFLEMGGIQPKNWRSFFKLYGTLFLRNTGESQIFIIESSFEY